MKLLVSLSAALLVSACSSIGHEVAFGINNSQLRSTVGKPYQQVMYERPDLGKLIGRESLSNGDQVMKHVGEFGKATSSVAGVYGKQDQQARVTYFRVDANGKITDWATEFYKAGSATCWVGICSGATKDQVPAEEFDRIVKTSSGKSIDSWRQGT
jgi:hypothetical protein